MAKPDPEGVVAFSVGPKRYRLFFGMRARKEVERYYDLPFFRAIQQVMPQLAAEDMADPAKVVEASASVKLTDVAKLFEFALAKFHPDIKEAEVDDVLDLIGLSRASELLGDCLSASMMEAGDDANPRKASQNKKTGSRS